MRIAKRIGAGLAASVAIGAAALLALAFVPTLFGYEALIVTSGSMGKAMPAGSVAVTRLVEAHAIAVDDVISFRYAGAPQATTHRVIEVAEEEGRRIFKTKGDANETPDPEPVLAEGSIHRVERVVPFAGTVVGLARSPVGGVILFVVPILGLTLDRYVRRGRKAATPARPRRARRGFPLEDAGWSVSTFVLAGGGRDGPGPVPEPQAVRLQPYVIGPLPLPVTEGPVLGPPPVVAGPVESEGAEGAETAEGAEAPTPTAPARLAPSIAFPRGG